jgi:hypothetical protein
MGEVATGAAARSVMRSYSSPDTGGRMTGAEPRTRAASPARRLVDADVTSRATTEPFAACERMPSVPGMTHDQLVALEYPNGREHMCTIKTAHELSPGAEFDMFGRAWRVSHVQRPPSRRRPEESYLVCVPVRAERR